MDEFDPDELEREFDAICEGKTLDDVAVEEVEKEIEEEVEEVKEVQEEEEEEVEEEEVKEEEETVDEVAARAAEILAAKEAAEAEDKALLSELDNIVNFADLKPTDQLFDLNDLPDIKVGSGESEVSMKELFEQYPAVMEAVNIMIGSTVKKAEVQATRSLKAEISNLKFRTEMEDIAPGTYKTVTSPEFKKWVVNQSEGIKLLAASSDRKDSKLVIEAYLKTLKPSDSKKVSTPKVDEPVVTKKEKLDKLLGSNVKSKTTPKPTAKTGSDYADADLDAEWDSLFNG